MKKTISLLCSCILLVASSCQTKDTNFLMTETNVGPLLKTTTVNELETVFKNDSLVMDTFQLKQGQKPKKMKVFDSTGLHLLTLTPNSDSIPKIENISIEDVRYTTANGISLNSTFKDILDAYDLRKIVTTMKSVVIFPKGSDFYFTIDKSELPANLRFTNTNIEAVQIPDDAKIKYLMLGWSQ